MSLVSTTTCRFTHGKYIMINFYPWDTFICKMAFTVIGNKSKRLKYNMDYSIMNYLKGKITIESGKVRNNEPLYVCANRHARG